MDQEKLTSMIWEALQEQNDNEAYLAPLNDDCSVIEVDGVVDLGRIAAAVLQSIGSGQDPMVSINLHDVREETAERVTAVAALMEQMVRATEGKFGFTINMVGDVLQASVNPLVIGMDLADGPDRSAEFVAEPSDD